MTSRWHLEQGDSLEALRYLPDESVAAVVTDPPSGIKFMGKDWDGDRGGRDQWIAWLASIMRECLRVLTPGGHAIVWALPRTSHWTATAIEDAGFEVRDVITHHFGSGFPKSLDVSKAIDKSRRRDFVQVALEMGVSLPGRSVDDWTKENHAPGDKWWAKLKEALPTQTWSAIERRIIGRAVSGSSAWFAPGVGDITASATDAAKQWDGWGTALKPATEHWILARKPLIGTVTANVLEHGTGALNIDVTRVGTTGARNNGRAASTDYARGAAQKFGDFGATEPEDYGKGRWPSHLLLTHGGFCTIDECEPGCPVRVIGEQSGESGAFAPVTGDEPTADGFSGPVYGSAKNRGPATHHGDTGTAARFFPTFHPLDDFDPDDPLWRYVPKPSKAEKNAGCASLYWDEDGKPITRTEWEQLPEKERGRGNIHPTVKPIAFMRWLIRLITPPGGTVLDPFVGSGTTGAAAMLEGVRFLGCDLDTRIAQARLEFWEKVPARKVTGKDGYKVTTPKADAPDERQIGLFGEDA